MENYMELILLLEKFQNAVKGEAEKNSVLFFEIKVLRKWETLCG